MRGEESVDKGGLAKARLANNHDVELESSTEQTALNLTGDGIKADRAGGLNERCHCE